MASNQTIILTQLSGLLEAVEASAKSLRTYLETQIEEQGAEGDFPWMARGSPMVFLCLYMQTRKS
jgi:hypothetical protein